MSWKREGRMQSLRVPQRLEADMAGFCNWKTAVQVPCVPAGWIFSAHFTVGMSLLGTL